MQRKEKKIMTIIKTNTFKGTMVIIKMTKIKMMIGLNS